MLKNKIFIISMLITISKTLIAADDSDPSHTARVSYRIPTPCDINPSNNTVKVIVTCPPQAPFGAWFPLSSPAQGNTERTITAARVDSHATQCNSFSCEFIITTRTPLTSHVLAGSQIIGTVRYALEERETVQKDLTKNQFAQCFILNGSTFEWNGHPTNPDLLNTLM